MYVYLCVYWSCVLHEDCPYQREHVITVLWGLSYFTETVQWELSTIGILALHGTNSTELKQNHLINNRNKISLVVSANLLLYTLFILIDMAFFPFLFSQGKSLQFYSSRFYPPTPFVLFFLLCYFLFPLDFFLCFFKICLFFLLMLHINERNLKAIIIFCFEQ